MIVRRPWRSRHTLLDATTTGTRAVLDDPADVAIYGAGVIAGAHAAAVAITGHTLRGVASRTRAHAQSRAAHWHTEALDVDHLGAAADIVVVATPAHTHAPIVEELSGAGTALLVETPLAATLADADRIVAAGSRPGACVAYAEQLLSAPVTTEMLRQVGSLGALTHVEARVRRPMPTWGGYATRDWGGGALLHLGVHPLALVMLLARAAGHGHVVGVRARLRRAAAGVVDVEARLTLRFAGGAQATVEVTWDDAEPRDELQVAGAVGVLRAELLGSPTLERDGAEVVLPRADATLVRRGLAPIVEFGHAAQLNSLVDAARRDGVPPVDASFGRDVLEVVCAAYAAAGGAGNDEVPLPWRGPRDLTPLELWQGSRSPNF